MVDSFKFLIYPEVLKFGSTQTFGREYMCKASLIEALDCRTAFALGLARTQSLFCKPVPQLWQESVEKCREVPISSDNPQIDAGAMIQNIRGVSEKYPTCVYIIFFDFEGVVHYEFAPRGQTINKEYYVEVLRGLLQDVEAPLGACGSVKWGLLRRMPRSGWRRISPTRRYERRSDTFRTHLVYMYIHTYVSLLVQAAQDSCR